jgi:hypothetical protein
MIRIKFTNGCLDLYPSEVRVKDLNNGVVKLYKEYLGEDVFKEVLQLFKNMDYNKFMESPYSKPVIIIITRTHEVYYSSTMLVGYDINNELLIYRLQDPFFLNPKDNSNSNLDAEVSINIDTPISRTTIKYYILNNTVKRDKNETK